MNNMKIFLPVFLFFLFPFLGKSQNADVYERQWRVIDSLIQKANRPKTALQYVNTLYKEVHSKSLVDQSIKSLAYKYVLEKRVTDKAELENTDMIDQALLHPINPLERSLLWFMKAGAYVNYYNRSQYNIQNKKDTLAYKDADWATWTLKDFQWKIYRAYQNALKDSIVLQKATIKQYPTIVQFGNVNDLRPTLYDLVVNSALDFYQNVSRYLWEKRKDDKILKSLPIFLQYDPQTNDSVSDVRNVILLYQRLLRFHLQDDKKDALVNVDNQRVDWFYRSTMYNHSFVDKDSSYLQSLRYIVQTYPHSTETLQSVYMMANYYNELANQYRKKTSDSIYRDKRITALSYIEQYLPKDTVKTNGWYNLAILKENITMPKVESISLESINMVNQPILALLKFYRLPKAYAKLIALSRSANLDIALGDSLIRNKKILQQFIIDLPKSSDYQSYTTEIKIDPLPVGKYMLQLSADEKGKSSRSYIGFQVSNLSYVNSSGNYFVVDRKTGKPIEGVKMVFDKKVNTDPIDLKKSQLTSDKDGRIVVRSQEDLLYGYNQAYLFKGNDTLLLNNYNAIPLVSKTKDSKKEEKLDEEDLEDERDHNAKILYFTDRNIYRPGQKIHFKAVVYTKDGDDSSYHIYDNVKDSILFFLKDVNLKKVDSLLLKPDKFGSVSGVFSIPNNVLTGTFTIDNEKGNDDLEIQVEEYKRPTFFVEIDSLKGTFKLNDLIPITGTAKAYNGSKVSNASVKLHVERTARFPYYWLHGYSSAKDILDTTIQTDEQGKFRFDFRAIPDEDVDSASLPVFRYSINAEVTDKNGETRTKESSVSVGYNSVDIQWNVVAKNAKLYSFKDLRVSVKNTNGIPVALPVRVKIQPVEQPKYLFRKKYWSQPDLQIMDSLTYKKYFPNDVYGKENEIAFWQKGHAVIQTMVASDSLIPIDKKLGTGWYYLEANITSPEGKELKDFRYVQLLPDGIPLTDDYLEGFGNYYTGHVGDTIKQYLSTAADEIYLTELQQNEKDESSFDKKILTKGTLPMVTVLNSGSDKQLNRTFAGYKDNRFYQARFNINIVPKLENLTVNIKTFRDRIEPGSKEKWSIQVLKDSTKIYNAQLLSAMYDASLDQILKGDWRYSIDNDIFRYRGVSNFSNPYDRASYGNGFVPYLKNPYAYILYPKLRIENGDVLIPKFEEKKNNSKIEVFDQMGFKEPESLNEVVSFNFGGTMKKTVSSLSRSVAAVYSYNELNVPAHMRIRGVSSVSGGNNPLYIVDGQVMSDTINISASDIQSINVLKDAAASSIYGARAANGAIIVTTKSQSYGKKVAPPVLRSNFSETAFFYPSLTADKDGNYWVEFTMPDAVTQWRWRNLVMDKELHFGYSEMMITSQKTLMIQPNMPRFLRAGDQLVLTAKVGNTGQKALDGKAFIQLLDADSNLLHWQKIDQIAFKVAADQSSTVAFDLAIPENYSGPLYVKMWAEGGLFSDGELHEIPVLSRKTLITETLPFEWKGDTVANLNFPKLLASDSSKTLQNKNLSIELAINPVWYAVQAIPYLQSYPYECSEQVFSRMYGGFLAKRITNTFPQIKSVLTKWENDPEALKSNLQKNGELKQTLLEETPWLNQAESEATQKRQLALHYNDDSVQNLLQRNFDLLSKRQLSNGSFSWYDGDWGDRYITQNVVVQYAHLQSLQAVDKKWETSFAPIIQKAKQYLSEKIAEDYENLKKWKSDLTKNNTSASQLMYLYALAQDSVGHKYSTAENYYLNQAKKFWNDFSNVQKAWIAEIFYRKGEKSFAVNTVIRSLMENAVESKTNGTYWKNSFDWGFGYLSNIETHSQIMSIVNQIADKEKDKTLKDKVEEMQHWLIRNKQTNYWSNTKATADACYALLTANTKWLDAAPKVKIQMGDTILNIEQQEAGTGYAKITIPVNSIRPSLGKIEVNVQSNPGYVYGGVYWQYLENMDKITEAQSPLSLAKTFYKDVIVNGEKHQQEVKSGDVLKVGEKLIVRIVVKSDRDMQYVHLKDLRPSNTEPDDAISGYQYKNNLGYYLSIKDVSSNFFFNNISKGTHILEYSMHVTHAGNFASGLASVQCMYAPEMSSHSEGTVIEAK